LRQSQPSAERPTIERERLPAPSRFSYRKSGSPLRENKSKERQEQPAFVTQQFKGGNDYATQLHNDNQ